MLDVAESTIGECYGNQKGSTAEHQELVGFGGSYKAKDRSISLHKDLGGQSTLCSRGPCCFSPIVA
jgi:hypothetical protein